MKEVKISLILAAIAVLLAAAIAIPIHGQSIQTPDAPCSEIQVEAGNKVAFRAFGIGVQVYRWNGTAWTFVEPVANLYADANYQGKVGTHYAGPTWESNSGSKVVATRVNGCSPDAGTIPWLLLKKVTTDGPGIFSDVTFVQRLKTTGGSPPANPGAFVGVESRVPYTAEYYFYRLDD
jgi:hypothetical protein